ncbi:MAG: VWA domain-containing protein, partial [Eubacteriales bacterium]|nr:VWA domain-containing protein [Eubacteriales bacterium]
MMKNILKTILIVIFFIFNSLNITFANNQISEQKEVIFVIDSSNSMKSFDKQRLALDEVKKIANSLTSEYKVGVVVYNTNIVDYANLSNDLAYFNSILHRTNYTGYTNAGEALEFALNMFSEETTYKNIIMVSDGEIVLQNESLTNNSNEKFIAAIDNAKNKGILIDTIALGELTKDGEKYNIFKASELTGGTVYKCDNILKLSKISNEILFNKFNIKKSLIGVANTTNGELNVNLPTTALDKVKILISSDEKIIDINVNFKAESANIINGENFTIVEITKPYEKNVDLKFTASGSIEAYLISEYNASLY